MGVSIAVLPMTSYFQCWVFLKLWSSPHSDLALQPDTKYFHVADFLY